MPANQSTPEVTRADEARRLIAKLAGGDIDVSGTAAIGITSADIIDANGWLAVDRVASTVMAGAGEDAEIKRLRGLLIGPGTPPWEDARAVLVAELRKAGFKGAAKQIEEGEGCNIPSHVALKLIAQAALSAPQVEWLTSGEGDARKLLVDMFGRRVGYSSRMAVEAMLAFAAASPKATATASVREEAVARVTAAWSVMMRKFGGAFGDIDNGYYPEVEEMRRSVASLTDSGTAATIGGERA